ncbi:hypothetical protein FKM82_026801 [Ascaphus truei]
MLEILICGGSSSFSLPFFSFSDSQARFVFSWSPGSCLAPYGPCSPCTLSGWHLTGKPQRELHKTADLDPQQNYIMGYHPHGIMSIGAFCNFGTDSTGFSRMFPGIKPHLTTLTGNFKLPLYRDYLMAAGMCSVNHSSIDYLLSRQGPGNVVVIVVGGAAEALNCTRGRHTLTLKNRKGFIKKALVHG